MNLSYKKFSLKILFFALTYILISGCTVLEPALPTPTASNTPLPTLTPTTKPSPTSTPTPTPPLLEHGLRAENASSQVYENGLWVVRNPDGKITAIWNAVTGEWNYSTENIIVEQVLIGSAVDYSIIEPYLGALPPDDPSTHFIDGTTGERVDYGVGPEMMMGVRSATEKYKIPVTVLYVRFRGAVPLLREGIRDPLSVLILEIPISADVTAILLRITYDDNLCFTGLADDIVDLEFKNLIGGPKWCDQKGLQMANEHLVGSMMLVELSYIHYVDELDNVSNERNRAILNYIAGKSTKTPYYDDRPEDRPNYGLRVLELRTGPGTLMYVPENQLPPYDH